MRRDDQTGQGRRLLPTDGQQDVRLQKPGLHPYLKHLLCNFLLYVPCIMHNCLNLSLLEIYLHINTPLVVQLYFKGPD